MANIRRMSEVGSGSRVLVIYATTHGHTAKVAAHVAETLRRAQVDCEVRQVGESDDSQPGAFEGVIVAASIHGGRHQRTMRQWVQANLPALAERPTAFLSVSLTAAEADEEPEAREATQHCIDEFVEETGWKPGETAAVAGALQYREYNMFTRTLMRLLMRRKGQPTDVSQDYEYTDWDALATFARGFAERLTLARR